MVGVELRHRNSKCIPYVSKSDLSDFQTKRLISITKVSISRLMVYIFRFMVWFRDLGSVFDTYSINFGTYSVELETWCLDFETYGVILRPMVWFRALARLAARTRAYDNTNQTLKSNEPHRSSDQFLSCIYIYKLAIFSNWHDDHWKW